MRFSITLLAFVALLSMSSGIRAMTVCPNINGAYLWDDEGTLKIKKGVDFAIEIQMDNPEPNGRGTVNMPLAFYGLNGVDHWTLVDKGGEIIPNIMLTNGFQHSPYPNPWFDVLDTLFVFDWDGQFGDTIVFCGSGIDGIPPGEPLLTRLEFWFRIDQEGVFCVDSCKPHSFPWPALGWWSFDEPVPVFNGPHCWEVGEPSSFLCGDANYDQAISIFDITYLINALYRNGMQPFPNEAGDNNADGEINILDVSNLVNYLYRNGPPPVCR